MNKCSIETELLYFIIHVNNNNMSGNMFYNFKDVGCYVKYNDKIFKIESVNTFGNIIHNGEIIDKDDCVESSLKELRISKIDKLLENV
jgi:glycine cleavage system H lipoate-binding protein